MKNIILFITGAALLSLSSLSFAEDQVCIKNSSWAAIKACNNPSNCTKIFSAGFTKKLKPGEVYVTYFDGWGRHPVPGADPIRLYAGDTLTVKGNIFTQSKGFMHVKDDDGKYITHGTCN